MALTTTDLQRIRSIAADASALIDMRSISSDALDEVAERIGSIIESTNGSDLTATVEPLGERPAGARPLDDALSRLTADILQRLGIEPIRHASNTDSNVPISLNMPPRCIGISTGGRAFHGRVHSSVSDRDAAGATDAALRRRNRDNLNVNRLRRLLYT